MRWLLPSLLALSSVACAESAPPKVPEVPSAPPGVLAGKDPFAVEGPLREEWLPLLKPPVIDQAKTRLTTPPPGLPPAPTSCAAYTTRKGAGPAPQCADPAAGLAALDAALAIDDGARRDAMLVDLESCKGLPAGVVLALRAELAPLGCAEGIVEPALKAPAAGMTGITYHALLGQAIAARLSRAAMNPPQLAPPFSKARVLDFIKGPMRGWFEEQARVIEYVSQAAAELPYYAKGIAAIEAGIADLRLVEAARSAPIPDEFAKDAELKNVYYGSLDQWLDPRKDRGRDAALIGLKELAMVGVLRDPRVDRARQLLSRQYGGRRIDALDTLLLPAMPKAAPTNVEERLAGKLPTLYAGILLDENAAGRPGTLRMLLEKGMPLPQKMALHKIELPPAARALYARGRLELGREYWTAIDIDQAVGLAASARTASPATSDEVTLTLAVALALHNGPDDAADMMRKGRGHAAGQLSGLDALKSQSPPGPYAGLAAFDAALLLQLRTPDGATVGYFTEVAERYRAAAALLTDATHKKAALERAQNADDIAKAISAAPPLPK